MFNRVCVFALLLVAPLLSDAATPLNDARIAHIAYTAGQIDIDAAKLALTKSTSNEVRGFAETMLRDHTAVNERALDLVKKLGVSPEDNDTSSSLLASAMKAEQLQLALSGEDFDRAYVDNEVAYHDQVNAALRSLLIPGATNPELKALLQDGLALFSEHQKHAEMLKAELAQQ